MRKKGLFVAIVVSIIAIGVFSTGKDVGYDDYAVAGVAYTDDIVEVSYNSGSSKLQLDVQDITIADKSFIRVYSDKEPKVYLTLSEYDKSILGGI